MAAVCTCVAAPSELCSARVYIELAGWLAEGARREAVRGDCWASFYCAALSTDSAVCRSLSMCVDVQFCPFTCHLCNWEYYWQAVFSLCAISVNGALS